MCFSPPTWSYDLYSVSSSPSASSTVTSIAIHCLPSTSFILCAANPAPSSHACTALMLSSAGAKNEATSFPLQCLP
jgi:hypothetical protein